jgi:transposase
LLSVAVHPANIQDRDGVALVLDRRTRRLFPFIKRIYGDGGYQGPKAAKAAAKTGCWTIEIVERSPTAVGFEVLPKRWIVNACTMLPSVGLIGHRSSNARAVGGHSCSLR